MSWNINIVGRCENVVAQVNKDPYVPQSLKDTVGVFGGAIANSPNSPQAMHVVSFGHYDATYGGHVCKFEIGPVILAEPPAVPAAPDSSSAPTVSGTSAKIGVLAAIAALAIGLTGCVGTKSGQINPGNLGAVLSQDNASVSFTGTTPYGDITINRTVPQAVNTSPIVPLTPAQLSSITNDPLASFLYGFSKDTASVDAEWHGLGGVYIVHRAMPPTTNNVGPLEVVVVNSATNPVPSVVSTNAPAK